MKIIDKLPLGDDGEEWVHGTNLAPKQTISAYRLMGRMGVEDVDFKLVKGGVYYSPKRAEIFRKSYKKHKKKA